MLNERNLLASKQTKYIKGITYDRIHKIFFHVKNLEISEAIINIILKNKLSFVISKKPYLEELMKRKPVLEEAIVKLNKSLNQEDSEFFLGTDKSQHDSIRECIKEYIDLSVEDCRQRFKKFQKRNRASSQKEFKNSQQQNDKLEIQTQSIFKEPLAGEEKKEPSSCHCNIL